MKKNRDVVFIADPRELSEARRHWLRYLQHKIAPLLLFIESPQFGNGNSVELNRWFESNGLHGLLVQQQLLQEIKTCQASVKDSCIALIKKIYRVDLIQQYQPLIQSTSPHHSVSQLIDQMQQLSRDRIASADMGRLRQYLISILPQHSPLCEAVSLLDLSVMSDNQALVHKVIELILCYEKEQRRLKTASEVFKNIWVNGKKITPKDYNTSKDPLAILRSQLEADGLDNNELIEFLQEYLNENGLLIAYDYFEVVLRLNSNHRNEGSLASYIEVDSQDQSVTLKMVRTYRKFSWVGYQDNSREKNLYAVNAQSSITVRIHTEKNKLKSIDDFEIGVSNAITVEFCGGELEVYDKNIRATVIRDLAKCSVKKIIVGEVANCNDELILDQLLVDYDGIFDHIMIVRKLLVDRDPLKIFLMARSNADVMDFIASSYELLICLCSDDNYKGYVEFLKFLYPYGKKVNEISKLLKLINLLHDDKSARADKYNNVLRLIVPSVQANSNKQGNVVAREMIAVEPLSQQDLFYLVVALHTLRPSNDVSSSPLKGSAIVKSDSDVNKSLRVSEVVFLLKSPQIRSRFEELWIINLALTFEEVARWLIDSAEIFNIRSLTSEQLAELLRLHPSLWAIIQDPRRNRRDLTVRLDRQHVQSLTLDNNHVISKEQAADAICRDEVLVGKLFRLDERPNELLRYLGDFSSNFKKTIKNYEERVSALVERCDEFSIDYYYYKMYLVLDNEEFSENFYRQYFRAPNERDSARTLRCIKNTLISILCERVKQGRIAVDLWKSDLVFSRLVQALPEEPRLACLLKVDKIRSYLLGLGAERRGYALAFAQCVVHNQLNPELKEVNFQILALRILSSSEFKTFILNPINAIFVINLIIKDHEAIELLIAAGVESNGYEINLILQHASSQQLLLFLLAITARKNQFINKLAVNEKLIQQWEDKISQCQRLIELFSASVSVIETTSPPVRRMGFSISKLEEQRVVLARLEDFSNELDKQIKVQQVGIAYIDNIIAKIISSAFYLQRLLSSKEFFAIDLACLISLYPEIVKRLVEEKLFESHQKDIVGACVILRPLLSASATIALCNSHPSINVGFLAEHEVQLSKPIRFEIAREVEAIVTINDGNLLCETLIRILRSNDSADELLYPIFYRHHVLHLLSNPMSVNSSNMSALLEELSIHEKWDFLHTLVNCYLISAFANNDILVGIISTPRLRNVIIRLADLRLLAKLICLIDMRLESPDDWLPFYDRFVNEPALLRVYKSVIDYHYHESVRMFFHVYAEGAKKALEDAEVSSILRMGEFHIHDFIKLLVSDCQNKSDGIYRNSLLHNNTLLDEVIIAASADELAIMLAGEIALRQGAGAGQQSIIEALLTTKSVSAEIFRYAKTELVVELIQLDSTLISPIISVRKHFMLHNGVVVQDERLLQLLVKMMTIEQFIELAIDCNKEYPAFKEYLGALRLRDLTCTQLINLLMIAQGQNFDYRAPAASELARWLQNSQGVCQQLLTQETTATLALNAIHVLQEYLPDSQVYVDKFSSGPLFHTILSRANIAEVVRFFVSEQGRKLVFPNDADKPSSTIVGVQNIIYRLFLLCNESQLKVMSHLKYIKVFIKKVEHFGMDLSIVQRVVAPRIVALVDNIYQHQIEVAENILSREGYLIHLFETSSSAMCLLTSSNFYQQSEVVRQLFVGHPPVADRQSPARNNHGSNDSMNSRNSSPSKRGDSSAVGISRARRRDHVYSNAGSQGDSSEHSSSHRQEMSGQSGRK